MKKKRIIYIGNKLSKHGHTPTSIETLGERLKANYNIIQASNKKFYFFRILDMWGTILFSKNIDMVLIDTYSSWAFHYAWTCGLLCRFKNIDYLPILHGGNIPKKINQLKPLYWLYFYFAKKIIVPSGYLKEAVEKKLNFSVELIPNFIDLDKYPVLIKDYKTIRILWVRAFHQIYNPKLAVDILNTLIKNGNENCTLCMMGPEKDGSMIETKKYAKTLGIDRNIEFTGQLSKLEWIEKSKNYNIFINTSNFDNTPVSVMEAMALSFPVISTNVGGMSYIIDQNINGILLSPNNNSVFVDAITSLFSSPNRLLHISSNARSKAESWDWNNIELKWAKILS